MIDRVKNVGHLCSEPNCVRPAHCKCLCHLHYQRLKKYGSTQPPGDRMFRPECDLSDDWYTAIQRMLLQTHHDRIESSRGGWDRWARSKRKTISTRRIARPPRERPGIESWSTSAKQMLEALRNERKSITRLSNPWTKWSTGKTRLAMSGKITAKSLAEKVKQQGYRCAYTGRVLQPEDAQPDHIVPRSAGGGDVLSNIQIIHRDINRAKNSMTHDAFVQMCREVTAWADQQAERETA